MPTRIRLQRHGRKGRPFYHIVIADGRAPRDGRFIEKIGVYNPLTKPADIDLDFDRALYWLQTGAQPSDTVRAIFSYKGILFKFHLLNGVSKGALTLEQVEEKFTAWLEEKETKIRRKISEGELLQKENLKKVKEQEVKLNESRAAEIAKKLAKEAEKKAAKLHKKAEEEQVEVEKAATESKEAAAAESEVPATEAKEAAATEAEVPVAEAKEAAATEAEVPATGSEETAAE